MGTPTGKDGKSMEIPELNGSFLAGKIMELKGGFSRMVFFSHVYRIWHFMLRRSWDSTVPNMFNGNRQENIPKDIGDVRNHAGKTLWKLTEIVENGFKTRKTLDFFIETF